MKRWGDLNVAVAERLNVAGALVVKLFGHPEAELDAFSTGRAAWPCWAALSAWAP